MNRLDLCYAIIPGELKVQPDKLVFFHIIRLKNDGGGGLVYIHIPMPP